MSRNDATFNLRLPQEYLDRIAGYAKECDWTKGKTARVVLMLGLEQMKNPEVRQNLLDREATARQHELP